MNELGDTIRGQFEGLSESWSHLLVGAVEIT